MITSNGGFRTSRELLKYFSPFLLNFYPGQPSNISPSDLYLCADDVYFPLFLKWVFLTLILIGLPAFYMQILSKPWRLPQRGEVLGEFDPRPLRTDVFFYTCTHAHMHAHTQYLKWLASHCSFSHVSTIIPIIVTLSYKDCP